MKKETNVVILQLINGVIFWGIGIDTNEMFAKIFGSALLVFAMILDVYLLFRKRKD